MSNVGQPSAVTGDLETMCGTWIQAVERWPEEK
jgi:hypothetical protein